MAKVQGGLFSLSASGTIGNSLTYRQRKGVTVCSIKSMPSNPKTTDQMKGRAYFAAGGKITKRASLAGTVVTFIKGIATTTQTWASFFVSEILGANNVNIEDAKAAYALAGNAAVKAIFDDAAAQASIEAVDLDGTANTQLSAGLILWAAYAASFRLSDPSAPDVVTAATEAHVFAYTQALTVVLPS